VLTQLIITTLSLFVFGALLICMSHGLKKIDGVHKKNNWIKYISYLFIIYMILFIAYLGKIYLSLLLLCIALAGSLEFYQNLKQRGNISLYISVLSFILLSLCLGHLLLNSNQEWFSGFAFVFLLVGITDSFSQMWGKLLGKHQLCPHLSPNKTWEGFWGGFISTITAAFIFAFLLPNVPTLHLLLFGCIISFSSIGGDLFFSYIKRKLSIKDFSSIIPGHGGILDRFDSLIVTAPVFYWTGVLTF
jgi:phosphatidate cytidylyltransferase